MGHIKGGKVRVLATGAIAPPALPDVPTLKELGYDASSRSGPASSCPRAPEPVVARLREAAKAP